MSSCVDASFAICYCQDEGIRRFATAKTIMSAELLLAKVKLRTTKLGLGLDDWSYPPLEVSTVVGGGRGSTKEDVHLNG